VIAVKEFSMADPDWHHAMNHWIGLYTAACIERCPPSEESVAPSIEFPTQASFPGN
jgi:hypothetical protein